jgi:hypothetical protein
MAGLRVKIKVRIRGKIYLELWVMMQGQNQGQDSGFFRVFVLCISSLFSIYFNFIK